MNQSGDRLINCRHSYLDSHCLSMSLNWWVEDHPVDDWYSMLACFPLGCAYPMHRMAVEVRNEWSSSSRKTNRCCAFVERNRIFSKDTDQNYSRVQSVCFTWNLVANDWTTASQSLDEGSSQQHPREQTPWIEEIFTQDAGQDDSNSNDGSVEIDPDSC